MPVNRKLLIITYIQNDLRTIGSNYVFASAKSHGLEVKMLYLKTDTELNVNALQDFLQQNNFGVIGIRVYTMDFYYTVNLTKIIRQIAPNSFIFWGGVHPTCEPEECLSQVDCICIGEGEQCVVDIVNNYERPEILKNFEGVGIRQKDGSLIINQAAYIDDIDALPYPYYEFNQNQYILDTRKGGGTAAFCRGL